ncbi:replication initiation and membrane attachment family protein [Isobaculum melis]|uniref:Replicative DNA helicase loader DnaB n=1 Tax=Isobaculum melis TaxID=142588 RepID=A0A1H9S8A5_9LACT|nr:DnaD domain protein [Isobaculum melis]SER81191.1 replicative DNA helicase loader DnaB [Isobaculum melis]
MENPWQLLNPKDRFSVKLSGTLTASDQKYLSFLYQPLIGHTAYSLYMTLWTEINEEKYWSEPLLHSELLMLLNIGIPELYQARVRLEGIGLLKTYQHLHEDAYVYELLAPLDSEQFFKEDLLNMSLFEMVGERKYQRLKQRFAIEQIDKTQYHNVTKSFLDVYRFGNTSQTHFDAKQTLTIAGKAKVQAPVLDQATFDWHFFYEGLASQYVNRDQVTAEIKETIIVLHEMYGIDELEMQRFVARASHPQTGEIEAQKLKKNVYAAYHQQEQSQLTLHDVVGSEIKADEGKELFRKNELRHQGFSEADITLIQSAKSFSPYDFISSIKEQKGGFVSKTETWVLDSLVKNAKLPTSVVNLLIHYILVVRGDVTLTQGLVDKIANDWSQDKISTPEKAMQKVQQMYDETAKKIQEKESKQQNRTQNNRSSYPQKNQSNRKETLPDWALDSAIEVEEKPLSAEEQAAFKEKLRKIQNFGKEGDA